MVVEEALKRRKNKLTTYKREKLENSYINPDKDFHSFIESEKIREKMEEMVIEEMRKMPKNADRVEQLKQQSYAERNKEDINKLSKLLKLHEEAGKKPLTT